ncbi:TBC1 domain family member 22 [Dermatophagoides pteronyssinus]|uniref:TBC1 domain family member 22 n=1 Tax=Dermatophagoides pteronyssinus TaxID=6956 RepID=UPI003F66C036
MNMPNANTSNSSNNKTTTTNNHNNHPNMMMTNRKFPGLARPSSSAIERHRFPNDMKQEKKNQQQQQHNHHNNNYSFEQFNASCDDAWNAKIEDKISYPNLSSKNSNSSQCYSTHNKHNKFGNNKSSILIKEIPSLDSNVESSSKQQQSTTEEESNYNDTCFEQKTKNNDPKLAKLKKLLLDDDITDLSQLRTITWSGIPDEIRPLAWKLLLGYLPTVRSKRSIVLENKKIEYQNLVAQYYNNRQDNDEMYRQIHIDIPRMQPLLTIFQQPIVQDMFKRILYIWSIRHPASGYVQGMNDLVTPFFVTYLSEFVPGHSFNDVELFDVSKLSQESLSTIEADSYWSFNKLLDSIQDNYTFAQPGIQRLVNHLSRVVSRVDKKLHEHLENNSVEYIQFAFRWMNNLLIREIPLRCIIRLWDTYLSEGALSSTYVPANNFNDSHELNQTSSTSSSSSMNCGTPFSSAFHLFVCAAFLRFWSKSLLQEQDFQGLMIRLQNLPTFHWSENEVKLLVADAYQLKYAFSPNHLKV